MGKEKREITLPPGAHKGAVRDNLEVICFAVLLIMFLKTFVGQQFTIPTGSMRNSLMIGDHLLINKFVFAVPQWRWEEKLFPMRSVHRGDIIVFRYPLDREQDYVKRCVAKEGDTLEVRNKRLYINGELKTGAWEHHFASPSGGARDGEVPQGQPEPEPGPWLPGRDMGAIAPSSLEPWPYLDSARLAVNQQGFSAPSGIWRDNLGPIQVPKGYVFAMGDNRENSSDSRFWGFLPVDHLRGKPFLVWWSFREGGNDSDSAKVPQGPGDVLTNIWDAARHFWAWTRWDRMPTLPR